MDGGVAVRLTGFSKKHSDQDVRSIIARIGGYSAFTWHAAKDPYTGDFQGEGYAKVKGPAAVKLRQGLHGVEFCGNTINVAVSSKVLSMVKEAENANADKLRKRVASELGLSEGEELDDAVSSAMREDEITKTRQIAGTLRDIEVKWRTRIDAQEAIENGSRLVMEADIAEKIKEFRQFQRKTMASRVKRKNEVLCDFILKRGKDIDDGVIKPPTPPPSPEPEDATKKFDAANSFLGGLSVNGEAGKDGNPSTDTATSLDAMVPESTGTDSVAEVPPPPSKDVPSAVESKPDTPPDGPTPVHDDSASSLDTKASDADADADADASIAPLKNQPGNSSSGFKIGAARISSLKKPLLAVAKSAASGMAIDEVPAEREPVKLSYTEDEIDAARSHSDRIADNIAMINRKKSLKDTKIRRRIENLVPNNVPELLACEVNWGAIIRDEWKAFVEKRVADYMGSAEPSLVSFIMTRTFNDQAKPFELIDDLRPVLASEAELCVTKLWKHLVFESKADEYLRKRGVA